jgi:hypothetical protein
MHRTVFIRLNARKTGTFIEIGMVIMTTQFWPNSFFEISNIMQFQFKKEKVKLSPYMSWRHIGGEEVI